MPLQTFSVDTSVLPTDVLSYCDDAFYQVVKAIAGPPEANLLEAQGIRSVYSFLNTEDVFDILTITCSALKNIKKSFCLESDDNTYIVKPGCRSNIKYLHQLLYQKHEEHSKQIIQKPKRNRTLQSQGNNLTDLNPSQDSVQAPPISSIHSQHLATSG